MTDITHKEVIAALNPEEKARLLGRCDRAGLHHLASQLIAILICGLWIAVKAPLWPLLIPVQGVLLVFLFTLCHECTHQTPFKSRRINEVVGYLSGGLILLPFLWFRYFHLAHHRHTNDPKHDPELTSGAKPETWGAYLHHLSGWGFWHSNVSTLMTNAFGRPDAPYLPPSRLADMRKEARILLWIYALTLLSLTVTPLLFWVWLLPLVVGQPALRVYLLAEHGRCPPVVDMLENTRTTITTRLVRWLAWNMPYHIEHHSFPNVPFHHLPDLHQHMLPHLRCTSPGYKAFAKEYINHLE